MKFDHIAVLMPCETLESFNLQRNGTDAEQLLSAWSALWHPVLLAAVRAIPRWYPATSPPEDPTGHLFILPDCCESLLPEDWVSEAEEAGAVVLRKLAHRDDMVSSALERLGQGAVEVDSELAADFLALGFCHLQVELMTRKLRYASNLDVGLLQTALLEGADALLQGDLEAARSGLQLAFDRLHDARDYSYSAEPRLLDLTLLAPTTLGSELQAELEQSSRHTPCADAEQDSAQELCEVQSPRNLLASAELIEEMAQRHPETLDALKRALAGNSVSIVGGEYTEMPLPLLEPEAIEANLRRGLAVYERHLGRRPKVFGRRRFGLTPVTPQILVRNGFIGAMHFTLDDGQFPTSHPSRFQWKGVDQTGIEAIGCVPLDASRAECFLQLAEKLGTAMNFDSAAVVVFAHWPGRSCLWYDDLHRIAAYSPIFGKFLTVDADFEQSAYAGQQNHFKPDEYHSPYLSQDAAGQRDPISRWVRHFQCSAALEAAQTLQTMAALCGSTTQKENDECGRMNDEGAGVLEESLADFAKSACGNASSAERGCLIVNPHSYPQPSHLHSSSLDIPAMGFTWIGAGSEAPPNPIERKGWFGRRRPVEPPPMAEENVLRNEFFEVRFDPHTGAIRSVSDYHSRHVRVAQQIALREPRAGRPDAEGNYSIMAADRVVVVSQGPVLGEMQSSGRLLDREGRRVAGFRQTTRVWRGSRVIELLIELDIERLPGVNPWSSYYAARFAWKDEAAILHRGVNLADFPTELERIDSPLYIDIRHGKQSATLLTGGLPYHRRYGPRKLDTLLVVRGETARSFRLGIAIDPPHAMSAALGFFAPPLVLADQPRPPATTGWLFHLDCRNVLATHWEPVYDGGLSDRGCLGFRVRLLETDGRGACLGLRCFRNAASAIRIASGDAMPEELTIAGDHIDIPMNPYQWTEVEVRFS
jgi:alpha-mannosidase